MRGVTLGLANGTTLFSLRSSFLYQGAATSLGALASIWIAGFLYPYLVRQRDALSPAHLSPLCDRRRINAAPAPLY